MPKALKSILAVVAGFIVIAALSIITDTILEAVRVFPPLTEKSADWMLVLALVYRCVYSVIGGYVVARLAPSKPMKHVIILIILGTIVGTLGAWSNWDKSVGQEWYPILLVILSIPAVWFGGKLKKV
jgi:hypothetical protein